MAKKKEKNPLETLRETILTILYEQYKKNPSEPLAGITIEEQSKIPYEDLKWNLNFLKDAGLIVYDYIEDDSYTLRPARITAKGIKFIEKALYR